MQKKLEHKNILWYTLAFMAFSTVWSFGNVVNGFSAYGGLKAIISWIIIFAIYFIPYSLMVGELGSAFKEEGGGVSSWINATVGPKLAYLAGWTYWVVHMPYISQKPSRILISLSWMIFGDKRISDANVVMIQMVSLVIFAIVLVLASRGVDFIKKVAALAGSSMFVMSLLFVVLALAAPSIMGAKVNHLDLSAKSLMPVFDWKFLSSLSILVFAVGGCEKISPYVNKMKSPAKDFPKGMIALVIMVAITAMLGTLALGLMFDSNNIPKDLMTNGTYYAFQKLGEYYHVGNLFMIIYAVADFIGQVSIMIISIDAPLRILIESSDRRFIPQSLYKQNKYGAYINGHKLIGVIIAILIIIPAFGIKDVDTLVVWLVKLNAVCMPLRYLWVFFAYYALKKAGSRFNSEYRFTKGKVSGYIAAAWCFFFTAFACILGMYSEDSFQLVLNIITPFILIGLGLVLPTIAKKQLAQND
ncbi:amino acid permease [Vaginisenegalia massiliensis]|uniref:amino acid permease n=1 Tax=Vaginisenegalia massiliensis TaxID=2058294 RepID=UPI000F5341BD|nr:amino acid permease [Vaginisenegalia massiliensis]